MHTNLWKADHLIDPFSPCSGLQVPGGAAMLRSIQSFLKAAGDEPLEDDQKREACESGDHNTVKVF